MAGAAVVLGLRIDAFAGINVLMPVQEHRAEACGQAVGDGDLIMLFVLRFERAEHGTGSAQNIHRVRAAGYLFEHRFERRR